MHKISLNTLYISPIGSLYKTIDAFKEAGFERFDISLSFLVEQCDNFIDKEDYLERTKKFKQYCDSIDMKCNQSHAFLVVCDKKETKEVNDYRWMMLNRSIEIAGIMEAGIIVIHPFSTYTFEENVAMFKQLNEVAKKNHVKIAIENMAGGFFSYPDSVNELLGALNDENIGFCLDTGHANLRKEFPTTPVEMIKKCSKYLICLHIDDNLGINDDHFLPGDGNIDFGAILKALNEVNYQGDYTFEVDGFIYQKAIKDKTKCLPIIFEIGKKIFEVEE